MEIFENAAFVVEGDDLAFLQGTLGGNLERRREGWAITRVVGHLALPSGEALRIRSSKASGASILAWMAFVDPALAGLRSLGRVPESVDGGDIGALAARLFFTELFEALGRFGLGRRYLRTRTLGSAVRGRIDFPALVRQGGDLSKLPCRVWERLPDTPLNRLLAAAVDTIAHDPVLRIGFATDVRRAQAALAGVPPRPSTVVSGTWELDRAERPFLAAQALARILVQGALLGEGAASAGLGFLVNLEVLFEKTVVRALTSVSQVLAKAPVKYVRIDQNGYRSTGSMEMDVFMPTSPIGPVVVDAKYKSSLSSANLQQMVAYCFAMGASSGVLVVPRSADTEFRAYEVTPTGCWKVSDRSAIAIRVLDLDTSARTVEQWRAAASELAGHFIAATHA